MSKKTCGVYLTRDEVRVVDHIARQRKWSVSNTLGELIRSSPDFKDAADALIPRSRKIPNSPAGR